MTTEEKFNAAVNVIRSLPKNGSYQPSTELMLRFYGYYKQATEGPCLGPRPAFWDIVNRSKYDAWKKLGDMPKTSAMAKYVEELHSIVETMSYSDKVANFLEAPTNELDNINMNDLALIAGDVIEKVRSRPNSPLASREASPNRFISSLSSSVSASSAGTPGDESDHSDDEYTDTIESPEPKKFILNGSAFPDSHTVIQKEHISRSRTKPQSNVDVSQEISRAVQSLKTDIDRLSNKIVSLENSQRHVTLQRKPNLFGGLSPQLLAFIIAWPFVATFLMNRFLVKRN